MILGQMPQRTKNHTYKRSDGETFMIQSTLYETPLKYNFWIGHFAATHQKWGQMGFQAIIPKSIATSVQLAEMLLNGSILNQVKSELAQVTAKDRNFAWCPSADGWHLVG